MACTMSGTSSQITSPRGITKSNSSKFCRMLSSNDLCTPARIRRPCSDNHLCYSVNQIRASTNKPKSKNSQSFGVLKFQLPTSFVPKSIQALLFEPEINEEKKVVGDRMKCDESDKVVDDRVKCDELVDDQVKFDESDKAIEDMDVEEQKTMDKSTDWIEKIMEIRSHWVQRQQKDEDNDSFSDQDSDDYEEDCDDYGEGCEVDYDDEESEKKIDSKTFPSLLKKVSLSDIKLLSRLAFLSKMAYEISEMKAEDLRRSYGFEFVTSSLEKKAEAAVLASGVKVLDHDGPHVYTSLTESVSLKIGNSSRKCSKNRPSIAFEIAASAAAFIQSRAKEIISLGSEPQQELSDMTSDSKEIKAVHEEVISPLRLYKSEIAAYVAASTMTAVVAASEEEKEEAAKELQSLKSSPCEWFVCDDSSIYTRCFVIQGSESKASWFTNLFFEPTKFEGTDALVHRGIYEAAKGMYEQFKPIILEHLEKYGERAKFQFTGHSLGGSLSLLVNLMLLTRKVVKPSALKPVVTFGSPFIFCGGQRILDELGLDENNIHCVIMHRDIVPRAFACDYPLSIAQILRSVNGSFRSHPCLSKNKLLYTPMGKVFILQPDERQSPSHPFLPSSSALYAMENTQSSKNALMAFLNSPHPLETLSDPTNYGPDGTILRDHDSSNYLKAVAGILGLPTEDIGRKAGKERNLVLSLLLSQDPLAWTEKVLTGV